MGVYHFSMELSRVTDSNQIIWLFKWFPVITSEMNSDNNLYDFPKILHLLSILKWEVVLISWNDFLEEFLFPLSDENSMSIKYYYQQYQHFLQNMFFPTFWWEPSDHKILLSSILLYFPECIFTFRWEQSKHKIF